MPIAPRIFRTGVDAMRTRFEFVLAVEPGFDAHAAAEEARVEVEACEDRLSLFRAGSLVSMINRSPAAPVRLDPSTFALLEQAVAVYRGSGGAFDPTVGPLMAAWGFRNGPGSSQSLSTNQPSTGPSQGMASLRLDPMACTACLACPETVGQLDLGAIAKGHALDLAALRLRELGVRTALLHGGTSSVLALGSPPDLPGWKVALWVPGDASSRQVVITLRDAALGVSASHGREITAADGTRLGHVMDPRLGRPAMGAAMAAAVCPDAASADAWSTAMLVEPRGAMCWETPALLGRLVAMRDGVVRSAVADPGRCPGDGTCVPRCTLEVGA